MTNHEAMQFLNNMIGEEHGRSIGADGFYRELCAYHVDALKIAIKALEQEPKTGLCRDCKYFEYDSVAKVDGIPLIVAHEICKRWGDGCKTKEDGYCFLFEPQEKVEQQESDHKCHTCKHYTNGEHDGSCGSYICKGYSDWERGNRHDKESKESKKRSNRPLEEYEKRRLRTGRGI